MEKTLPLSEAIKLLGKFASKTLQEKEVVRLKDLVKTLATDGVDALEAMYQNKKLKMETILKHKKALKKILPGIELPYIDGYSKEKGGVILHLDKGYKIYVWNNESHVGLYYIVHHMAYGWDSPDTVKRLTHPVMDKYLTCDQIDKLEDRLRKLIEDPSLLDVYNLENILSSLEYHGDSITAMKVKSDSLLSVEKVEEITRGYKVQLHKFLWNSEAPEYLVLITLTESAKNIEEILTKEGFRVCCSAEHIPNPPPRFCDITD